jgi:chemotaxis-related protein WspB
MPAMLFLTFRVGDETYALDTADICEILPLLRVTRVPHAPSVIAGLVNYRGRSVPVVDLRELILGEPARAHISTRLILVRHGQHLLGLIAERATEMMRREPASFADTGLANETARYLGPVTHEGGRLIRRFEVQRLPPAVSDVLFRQVQ